MLDSLSQTPNDVARVVHHMYKMNLCVLEQNVIFGINLLIIDGEGIRPDLSKRLSKSKAGGVIYQYLRLNEVISKKLCDMNTNLSNKERQYEMDNSRSIRYCK